MSLAIAMQLQVSHINSHDYSGIEVNVMADKTEAISQFEKLIQALASVGLETEVRPGEDHSLLVFVKATSQDHLYGEVYRSRSVMKFFDAQSLLVNTLVE
jgi:hypothetical protein